MLPQNFIVVGSLLYVLSGAIYIVGSITGRVRPNRISYAIWASSGLIAFFAALDKGAGLAAVVPLGATLGPALIFLTSLLSKKAYWRIDRFDAACGALSLIGLILWQVTGEGNLAIGFSIASDALACVPTIRKSYSHPETESKYGYALALTGTTIAVLSLPTPWMFAAAAFPVYQASAEAVILGLLFRKSRRSTTEPNSSTGSPAL